MKLKKLYIDGFKNLNNFNLDFTNRDAITVLIGNNGSGKSNVIEAISAIFADLYNYQNTRRQKINFSYKLEYRFNEFDLKINVVKDDDSIDYYFAKLDNGDFNPLNIAQLEQYLPSNILMLYSGDDVRIMKQYYEPFTRKFQKSIRSEQVLPSLPKMLYINSFFWTISLLSLLKSDLGNNKEFCKRILKNTILKDIKISFLFNQDLIQQSNSFLNELSDNAEETSITLEEFKKLEYLPNEKDLFVQLTGMIGQKNKIKKLSIINDNIDTIYLSEGEKKQILIRATLEILADENSLVLMDEPDANIHIANKIQIKTLLEEYPNRENILTTHSPTLTHHFDDKHIIMLNNGKVEDKTKQEIFSHITNGIWNYQEQSIFLSSTKEIILLVEGKHDKIHIEEAIKRLDNNYPELNFDVFNMNGEPNIKHMILGLANNGVNFNNKKIIAIFDNDKAGKDSFNKNFKKIENKEYKQLVDNNGNASTIFFGFMLPKTNGFKNDFTIENMYNGTKYKDAFTEAFSKRTESDFFNDFIDEVSKSIKEDSKNVLADNCKNFRNEDFEHFKKLFNIIQEIKEQ